MTATRTLRLPALGDATVSLHRLDRVEVTTAHGEASMYRGDAEHAHLTANMAYHLLGKADEFLQDCPRAEVAEAFYVAVNVLSGRCPDGCCGLGVDVEPDAEQARHLARVAWAADLVGRALGLEPAPLRDRAYRVEAEARLAEVG